MINSLRFGLLLTLLAVTAYYALLHAKVLQIGHPITQDEPGFIELTASANPYTHDGVLSCGNVYGPGYAIWARPFTTFFANPYIAHRWASSGALFVLLALLAWVLRLEGVGRLETGAGLGIVYILHVSSHSLSASADLLGAALYLATLTVSRHGTWPALLAGLALTVMAALTKPYFALGWVIVASHLLLFGLPRKALAYLGLSGLLALCTAGVLRAIAPYYFLSTVTVHGAAAVRRFDVLLGQSAEFALLAGGVLVLALLVRPRKFSFALSLRQPWLSPAVDFWAWAALLAAAVLLGSLGWHPGNYLVYYYQLLLGPLVIVALRQLPEWPRLGRVLLCANLLALGYLLPPLPANDHWDRLAANVAATPGPVLADPLLEPFTHTHPHLELLAHGQTATLLQSLDHLGPDVPAAYTGLHRELLQLSERLTARIRAREFAAIYVCYCLDLDGRLAWSYEQRHIAKTLMDGYQPKGEIPVTLYATPYWARLRHGQNTYHVMKWVPK